MTTFSQWRRGEGPTPAADLAVPEGARAFQGERAGFPSRVVACCIDVGLIAVLMVGIWVVLSLIELVVSPAATLDPPRASTLVVWGYLFTVLLWTFSWATSGRSPGAWFMGVRVINRKGEKLSWPMSLLRAAFCVSFPFGLIWALFSKRNRSLQDIALRTIVIYDWVVKPPALDAVERKLEGS